MEKAIACVAFILASLLCITVEAEEAVHQGGFISENPFGAQESATREGIYVEVSSTNAVVRYYCRNRLRAAYYRYLTHRDINHDRLMVFGAGSYFIIRINRQGQIASATSDGSPNLCSDSENDEICARASRILQTWRDRINFESYIRWGLEGRYLPPVR